MSFIFSAICFSGFFVSVVAVEVFENDFALFVSVMELGTVELGMKLYIFLCGAVFTLGIAIVLDVFLMLVNHAGVVVEVQIALSKDVDQLLLWDS